MCSCLSGSVDLGKDSTNNMDRESGHDESITNKSSYVAEAFIL